MLNSKLPRFSPKPQRGGTFVGFFIGVVIGVVISAIVVWFAQNIPNPFRHGDKSDIVAKKDDIGTGAPVALPGKPGESPPTSVNIAPPPAPATVAAAPLPADASTAEEPVTDVAKKPAATPADIENRLASAPDTEHYFLQAGAYRNNDEANNQKARIALMGIDVKVIPVSLPNDEKLYRVRVGPFNNTEDADRIRDDLSTAGITAVLVTAKDR